MAVLAAACGGDPGAERRTIAPATESTFDPQFREGLHPNLQRPFPYQAGDGRVILLVDVLSATVSEEQSVYVGKKRVRTFAGRIREGRD